MPPIANSSPASKAASPPRRLPRALTTRGHWRSCPTSKASWSPNVPGNLRFVSPDGKLSAPLKWRAESVWAKGQGGLLDVVLSPDFKQDRLVYLSYAEGGGDGWHRRHRSRAWALERPT
jgi:glucose/arabinose dehydrogenase